MAYCGKCGGMTDQYGRCPVCDMEPKVKENKGKKIALVVSLFLAACVVGAVLCFLLLREPKDKKETATQQAPEEQQVQTAEEVQTVEKEEETEFVFRAEDYDESGSCGKKVQWGYTEATGELVICGEGAMEDYWWEKFGEDDSNDRRTTAPWGQLTIKSVKLIGVTNVGEYSFYYCREVTSVEMPDSVIKIGQGAFMHCDALTEVKWGSDVQTIETLAFSSCESLEELTIPEGVTTVDEMAFTFCSSLKEITLPSTLRRFGSQVFLLSGLTDVYYNGTEDQWEEIQLGDNEEYFADVDIHFS